LQRVASMIAVTLRKVLTPYLMPHLLELEHLFCEPKAPSMVSWLAVPGRHPGEPRVVADNVVHRERPQVWHDGLLAVTAGALLAQCPWSKCRFNRDASGVSLATSAQRGRGSTRCCAMTKPCARKISAFGRCLYEPAGLACARELAGSVQRTSHVFDRARFTHTRWEMFACSSSIRGAEAATTDDRCGCAPWKGGASERVNDFETAQY
jgi:hypothetical protein